MHPIDIKANPGEVLTLAAGQIVTIDSKLYTAETMNGGKFIDDVYVPEECLYFAERRGGERYHGDDVCFLRLTEGDQFAAEPHAVWAEAIRTGAYTHDSVTGYTFRQWDFSADDADLEMD